MEIETISPLISNGAYRFHDFATLYWLNLVEEVLSTYAIDTLPEEFMNLLETFWTKRETSSEGEIEDSSVPHHMILLKQRQPTLAAMLCNSISFRKMCDSRSFGTRGSECHSPTIEHLLTFRR
jgi:hypothetical protein